MGCPEWPRLDPDAVWEPCLEGKDGAKPWGTVHQISGALPSVLGLLSFSAGLLLGGQTVLANGQLKETEGTAGGKGHIS